jgi:beta-glucosidase
MAFMNPALPTDQRVQDLLKRMTLEEKLTQIVNQSRAIPRLGIPAYEWWSEGLHGMQAPGTTVFHEPVGLGATFDSPAIHEMAATIGIEARVKHMVAGRAGHSGVYEGLDLYAPNINIFRDPRWGRGQETYGEDPFLTARMGVAYVKGLQGDDPKYYLAISTPKHYAVHSGPESTRHTSDVKISKHDELDTYLPAFRAAIVEGKADAIMCAYNRINGQPACANEFLLNDQLRNKWGFKGYVVSDLGAITDIFQGHHYKATYAEAGAEAFKHGVDMELIDMFDKIPDDRDYKAYRDALNQGLLKESDIDVALGRLLTARMRLGMFDPPEMIPYSKIDEKELDSPAHRALARKLANESMVLLKNDGILPLRNPALKIAVVGPLADQTKVLLGNYSCIPTRSVSVLEGLKAEFPSAQITYVPGTQFLRVTGTPVPAELLTTPDGKPGLQAVYITGGITDLMVGKVTVLTSRLEPTVRFSVADLPKETKGADRVVVQWSGSLTPQDTGDYNFGVVADGISIVSLDGKPVAMAYETHGAEIKTGRVHLEKGKKADLKVMYSPMDLAKGTVQLIWSPVNLKPSPEVAEAAKNADVVVAVVGITSELEGEEMLISEEGFKGGDRTSLDLPKPEQYLLESAASAGKPMVVVLMNGSALGVNWASQHANAIVEAWYPGEEGGAAVAETLSGKNNPAGRLPVTFYKGVDQLPAFENYAMKGRTYRYFEGTPLYPFGYGLSYTNFAYSGLKLPEGPVKAGDPVEAAVTVTNAGKVAGDEVVQLYLSFPDVAGAPLKALRGFKRIHLDPGASQVVHFDLSQRDLSIIAENGDPTIAAGSYQVSVGGGQPKTQAFTVSGKFSVAGSLKLPE